MTNDKKYTLREMRESRDIAPTLIADSLGVSYNTIRNWENGESIPNFVVVTELLAIYEYTPDQVDIKPFYDHINKRSTKQQASVPPEVLKREKIEQRLKAVRAENAAIQ